MLGVVWLAGLLLSGCADFGYERVRLGQEQRAYRSAFPADKTRATATGLCYLARDPLGRTDAVVLLLTPDRRVAAKLHATHFQRDYGWRVETGYRLRGEMDPGLLRLGETGPIDLLRAVAAELTVDDSDTFVRQAHGWVAAGLVRLVQHWPHVGDAGPALTRLTEVLEQVPGGGEARITVRSNGVYLVEYRQGAAH